MSGVAIKGIGGASAVLIVATITMLILMNTGSAADKFKWKTKLETATIVSGIVGTIGGMSTFILSQQQ